MPSRVARLRLAQAVESHLDTAVVAAFEAPFPAGAGEDYPHGQAPEFMLAASCPLCSGARMKRPGLLGGRGLLWLSAKEQSRQEAELELPRRGTSRPILEDVPQMHSRRRLGDEEGFRRSCIGPSFAFYQSRRLRPRGVKGFVCFGPWDPVGLAQPWRLRRSPSRAGSPATRRRSCCLALMTVAVPLAARGMPPIACRLPSFRLTKCLKAAWLSPSGRRGLLRRRR